MKALVILITAILIALPIAAQEDVPRLTYNESLPYAFEEAGEQFFAQFEGAEGDVVYFLARYTDFVIGNLDVDLRDSVGRTVGFKEEYAFQNFVIAELPAAGLYTVVVTAEEPGAAEVVVGKSGYVNNGVELAIERDGFQALAMVTIDSAGDYTLSMERVEGEMGIDLTLVNFSEFFSENVVTIAGTNVGNVTADVQLEAGSTYLIVFDNNIFYGDGDRATVLLTLTPA
jgi:hypothetical protein